MLKVTKFINVYVFQSDPPVNKILNNRENTIKESLLNIIR